MEKDLENAFTEIDKMVEDDHHDNKVYNKTYSHSQFIDDDVENEGNKISRNKKRRKEKKGTNKESQVNPHRKKCTNRKIVNLPATQPYFKMVDGEKKMAFRYNTRLSASTLSLAPKESVVDDEFTISVNVDSVDISTLNEKFKMDNCIYPRANLPLESYTGNRWYYETSCNKTGWQLVALNSNLLYAKKGLIQRSVDSYRQLNKISGNNKYFKDDSFSGDIEKRKGSHLAKFSQLEYSTRGVIRRSKVFTDINPLEFEKIPDSFKTNYAVFPEEFKPNEFGQPIINYKNSDNVLAVKLGFLNLENATFQNAIKNIGLTSAIKGAVELYKRKISNGEEDECHSYEKDAGELVIEALNSALDEIPFENEKSAYFNTSHKSNRKSRTTAGTNTFNNYNKN